MLFSYSIVAVDPNPLWQLTQFRCGSWRISVVAVGGILLWQLAELSVLLIITESNMTMIIKDNAKFQKNDESEGYFSGNQVYFSRIQELHLI